MSLGTVSQAGLLLALVAAATLSGCGQQTLDNSQEVAAALATGGGSSSPQATERELPTFDCNALGERASSIEMLICQEPELAKLDQQLAEVYAKAGDKAVNEQPPLLKAEQRGWIKGRNECWKNEDKLQCTRDSYQRRIVELQARYHLVASSGPVFFACDGNPANELVTTFFETEPATMIAERGDRSILMFSVPSGSGAKYQGGDYSFWEHHGEARVTWGYGAEEMLCKPTPQDDK